MTGVVEFNITDISYLSDSNWSTDLVIDDDAASGSITSRDSSGNINVIVTHNRVERIG